MPDALRAVVPLYYLILPSAGGARRWPVMLGERGIQAVFHYQPLHLSPMGRRFGGRAGDCPVTETVSDRLLRLPLFYELGDDEQEEVIDAIACFRS